MAGPALPLLSWSFFVLVHLQLLLTTVAPLHDQAHSTEAAASDQQEELPLLFPTNDQSGASGDLRRSDFPKDFLFGAGTSAYQVEGGAYEGGRGVSIWDTWAHTPGNIHDGSNGDVAVDFYHRYEEDIGFVADMNMNSYRFSISWPRIFPNGTGPQPNLEGIAFYNRVIDALLSKGVKPFVTLYHWDLPQTLQDAYGGWLGPQIVKDFTAYAEVCFAAFGDRVKNWVTLNEPGQFLHGYGGSSMAPPGKHSRPGTEPYLAAHNVLLAHADTVDIYRRKFQAQQGGVIGITLDCEWGAPLSDSAADKRAAHRHVLFQLGWFLDPIYFGDYPAVMRENVGSRLPEFSSEHIAKLKGSLDFIGLNQYTSRWVTDGPGPLPNTESSVMLDQHVTTTTLKDGVEIGSPAASQWLVVVPWGLHELLKWTWGRYAAPIYVTENGMDYSFNLPVEDSLHDTTRVNFFQDYISALRLAFREGVDLRGYFAWSLLDNFEWSFGFGSRFGLIYVDYNDNLKRYPKDSARWFSQFLDKASWKDQ